MNANNLKKNNLTLRYSFHQIAYWAAIGGVVTFAAAYLLGRGFTAAQTGRILCAADFFSFIFQPLLASAADRAKKNIIPLLMFLLSLGSILCFAVIRFTAVPFFAFCVLYAAGVLMLDMQVPLLNSVSVYYTSRSWLLNYGLGRGMGGFGYALATLGYGYIMDRFGNGIMPLAAICLIIIYAVIGITYPSADSSACAEALSGDSAKSGNKTGPTGGAALTNKAGSAGDAALTNKAGSAGDADLTNKAALPDTSEAASVQKKAEAEASTLPEFILRNKWYCLSLFGVLFLAAFHVMIENFLIEILDRLGGGSSEVGIALFVATLTELPAMMSFAAVHKKLGSFRLFMISGVSFIFKSVLLIFAGSVGAVYAIQILQVVTYVPLSTIQMFYANECISGADMVKGQSVITAFYTLGCAAGNLLGGSLISASGVSALLLAGVVLTCAGTAVLFFTVPRALKTGR